MNLANIKLTKFWCIHAFLTCKAEGRSLGPGDPTQGAMSPYQTASQSPWPIPLFLFDNEHLLLIKSACPMSYEIAKSQKNLDLTAYLI